MDIPQQKRLQIRTQVAIDAYTKNLSKFWAKAISLSRKQISKDRHCFERVAQITDELGISTRLFVNAQFSVAFTQGMYVSPAYLCGPKCLDRLTWFIERVSNHYVDKQSKADIFYDDTDFTDVIGAAIACDLKWLNEQVESHPLKDRLPYEVVFNFVALSAFSMLSPYVGLVLPALDSIDFSKAPLTLVKKYETALTALHHGQTFESYREIIIRISKKYPFAGLLKIN